MILVIFETFIWIVKKWQGWLWLGMPFIFIEPWKTIVIGYTPVACYLNEPTKIRFNGSRGRGCWSRKRWKKSRLQKLQMLRQTILFVVISLAMFVVFFLFLLPSTSHYLTIPSTSFNWMPPLRLVQEQTTPSNAGVLDRPLPRVLCWVRQLGWLCVWLMQWILCL